MPRMTKQKQLLTKEVKSYKSFFDAYKLHENVSKKDKKIGLATVYRFLNYLEKTGEIHSFLCNNQKIYSKNKTNHSHFTCERCKETKHIAIKNADFLKQATDEEVCHFQLELVGVCSKCKKRIIE